MKKLLLILMALFLWAGSSWAQINSYGFNSAAGTYTEITGGTVVATATGLSGAASFWWWETWDQLDAYRHYRPLAAFLAEMPFATAQLQSVSLTTPTWSRSKSFEYSPSETV